MLVNGNGESLLCLVLPDDILVQKALDLARLRKRWSGSYRLSLLIVRNDLIADVYAFIANVDGGTRNKFFYFIL